ncbi:MAG: (deoxy)nucleoside triphosphate pyrophosphohydrolase [Eggerthellaceae bacterium]|nr:(deoxy)nucleoside triphosphate pyrophosphohydrolase [Eggerthellaceae bacterium]
MKRIEIAVAVCEQNGAILATQRGYGDYKGWWEFPGGKLEAGETSSEALIREMHEELHADIEIRAYLGRSEYTYPQFHVVMHAYLCTLLTQKLTLTAHSDVRWLALEDLDSVTWLEADIAILEKIRAYFESNVS